MRIKIGENRAIELAVEKPSAEYIMIDGVYGELTDDKSLTNGNPIMCFEKNGIKKYIREIYKSQIPEPEDCTYFFETFEAFQAERNNILTKHNYDLSEITIGFGDGVDRLYTAFYNVNLVKTPKYICGRNIKDVGYIFAKNTPLISTTEDVFDYCKTIENVSFAFYFDYNMKTNIPAMWDTSRFPNITINNNYATACTAAANYNSIPNGWK